MAREVLLSRITPSRLLSFVIGLFFIAAAISKAWHIEPAIRMISFFVPPTLAPAAAPFAIAIGVIAWEGSLGMLLFLAPGHRGSIAAAASTLFLFSCVLALLLRFPNAPSCGCLGLGGAGDPRAILLGLVRNAALLGIAGYLYASANSQHGLSRPHEHRHTRSAGFSIIELLVCIVVLSILLALALPMLSNARRTATDARTQSDLRQTSSILHLYTADYAGVFPYFHTTGNPTTPAILRGIPLAGISYFGAGRVFWPNVLDDDVRRDLLPILNKDRASTERANVADDFPIEWLRSSIYVTHTVFADPAYFSADEPPLDPSHFRATRPDEVLFPSHKGLLVSRSFRSRNVQGAQSPATHGCVAFADAHAQWLDWTWPDEAIVSRPFGADVTPWLVLSTRHGLRGRDLP